MTIYERLDEILPRIQETGFKENKGLGNEIGFYIFDYNPEDELIVREHIEFLKNKVNIGDSKTQIIEFNLYDIMIEILEDKNYIDKVQKMEEQKGSMFTFNAIKKTLRLTSNNDLIVEYISSRVDDDSIIFITGVGNAWPVIRSHTVLNSLHSVVEDIPLVMFFPGEYDGLELILLNEIKDDNYYRAFQLVAR